MMTGFICFDFAFQMYGKEEACQNLINPF